MPAREKESILERHLDPGYFEEPSTRKAKAYCDIQAERWHHLTMIIDGFKMIGYIDGGKAVEATNSTFPADNDLTGLMTYMDSEHLDRRWDEDPVAGNKGFAVFDNFVVAQGANYPGMSRVGQEHFSIVRTNRTTPSANARILSMSGRAMPQAVQHSHSAVVVVPDPTEEGTAHVLVTRGESQR